ncbi:hypothetical protein [Paraburkholderia sp. BCC1885]|uniref:hypothetical protein n=1 Tax=Paraburkholderia sp. BCC1885 TaxID=2562669 RepID=UPI001183F15E|nr:hypothetical protein [Paraburkholderia sp. BCC1885]
MANRIMSVQQRQICEFLMLKPGATSADIVACTGFSYDAVKKKLRILKESGHVKGSEANYRATYQLTGAPFPRLAAYRPSARYEAQKALKARRARQTDCVDPVADAMYEMVTVGRSAT